MSCCLYSPNKREPTKVARRFLEDGTKVRVSKKTGHIIPKPKLVDLRRPRSTVVGPKDTLPADVFEVTFSDYTNLLPKIYSTYNA